MKKNSIYSSIIFFILIFLMHGCASVPKGGRSSAVLQDLCEKYNIQWHRDEVSNVVTLIKGSVKAMALIGSDSVIVDKEKIALTKAVKIERRKIIVPYDFKYKVVDRLIDKGLSRRLRTFTVVIDAGHGGKDPGAISRTGYYEKHITLDITRQLRKILISKGARVILTRDKDEFITLQKRTEIASRAKADVFVSIHANSNPSRKSSGVEVWSSRVLKSREKREAQRKKNAGILFDRLSMKKSDPTVKNIVSEMLSAHKKEESERLAAVIVKDLSRDIGARNRGVKKSGFFVLRNNLMPAVLVETGFLSNYREEKLLKKSSYRKKIAKSLAESILSYAVR